MTVTPGVSSPVSAAVSAKRLAVSPSVSPSRGNSYQDSSGSSLGEKEEIGQIDPQSSILNPARESVTSVSSSAFQGSTNVFRLRAFHRRAVLEIQEDVDRRP